jgi:hypothetical protein
MTSLTEASKFYVGSHPVQKIFVGSNKVWPKTVPTPVEPGDPILVRFLDEAPVSGSSFIVDTSGVKNTGLIFMSRPAPATDMAPPAGVELLETPTESVGRSSLWVFRQPLDSAHFTSSQSSRYTTWCVVESGNATNSSIAYAASNPDPTMPGLFLDISEPETIVIGFWFCSKPSEWVIPDGWVELHSFAGDINFASYAVAYTKAQPGIFALPPISRTTTTYGIDCSMAVSVAPIPMRVTGLGAGSHVTVDKPMSELIGRFPLDLTLDETYRAYVDAGNGNRVISLWDVNGLTLSVARPHTTSELVSLVDSGVPLRLRGDGSFWWIEAAT